MRDYGQEFENRVQFIKDLVKKSGARGIVFGNSGGKDSALVGILCKAACEDTVGIIMPCTSQRNYTLDADDGRELAEQFGIETRIADLTPVKNAITDELSKITVLNESALINIAPRLRMTTLYAVAAAEGRLVAGTGNRSEMYIGYFTKWGDGAQDFNPISDLTVKEVFEFLEYLNAPASIITKAPSAGLSDDQTDEDDLGFTYADLDEYILTGKATEDNRKIFDRKHASSAHKRCGVVRYKEIIE